MKTITFDESQWKLVPVEPTEEMFVAFAETWFSKGRPIDDCGMEDCYVEMLAAAPSPQEGNATAERTREQIEAAQRARVAEVFGRRKPSGATADFDLIAPSDEISNPTTPTTAAVANGDGLALDELAVQCGASSMVSSFTHPNGPRTSVKFKIDDGSLERFVKAVVSKATAADADGQKGGQHG